MDEMPDIYNDPDIIPLVPQDVAEAAADPWDGGDLLTGEAGITDETYTNNWTVGGESGGGAGDAIGDLLGGGGAGDAIGDLIGGVGEDIGDLLGGGGDAIGDLLGDGDSVGDGIGDLLGGADDWLGGGGGAGGAGGDEPAIITGDNGGTWFDGEETSADQPDFSEYEAY